ncbi:MAG: prolipoprotein diacylglyceryl transferase [Acetobacteraceae bacterium]|nr:prolipoprotein diacylglyceryl transferase [Acetobacteraceae bacterium]
MRPVLFHVGPLAVHAWGLMFAVAFAAGTIWAYFRARRAGEPQAERIIDLAVWGVVGTLVGSRIGYVLLEPAYYLAHPLEAFRLDLGGLSFHGGLAGGLLVIFLFTRRVKLPGWKVLDWIAPPVALGYAVARIGCFLNGCCYGVPSKVPWALNFFDVPRHPTQLYSLLGALLVLFGLLWLERRIKPLPFPSFLWFMYMGMYSVTRFMVEFWREAVHIWGWLTVAQAFSLALALASFLVVWVGVRRARARARAAGGLESAAPVGEQGAPGAGG